MARLGEYGPIFRNPKTSFGKWHGTTGNGTSSDPLTLPWFERSRVATQFCEMLNKSGWVLRNFDWADWGRGPEGQRFFSDRQAIATADRQQVAKLLTTLVRQDRFVEGALLDAYDNKILLTIVERAEALVIAKADRASKRKNAPQVRESLKRANRRNELINS